MSIKKENSITEQCKRLGISRQTYYKFAKRVGHKLTDSEIINREIRKGIRKGRKPCYYSYRTQFRVVFCFLNSKNMVESDKNGEIYHIEIVNAKDTEMAKNVFIKQFEKCKIQPEIIEIVRIKRKNKRRNKK